MAMPAEAPPWRRGWWAAARPSPSPNFGPRPAGVAVSLLVVHSISLPPGVYGGDAVERLFHNRLDTGSDPAFAALQGLEVSAHFFIRRGGETVQFVGVGERAWHAGRSSWRGRPNCNDWSVGVELEGLEGEAFAPAQYAALARLTQALAQRYPITEVVGHEHIAPGRKGDPGARFDWPALAAATAWPRACFAPWAA